MSNENKNREAERECIICGKPTIEGGYCSDKNCDGYVTPNPEPIQKEESDWMNKKQKIVQWDAINGDFYEHESLSDALKDIKENYSDSEEGIHPDIETIRIFKEVADVVLTPVEGKDTFRITLKPNSDTDDERSVARDDQSGSQSRGTKNDYPKMTAICEVVEPRPPKNNSEDVYRWVKASERLPEATNGYAEQIVLRWTYDDERVQLRIKTANELIDLAKYRDKRKLEWLEKITPDTK